MTFLHFHRAGHEIRSLSQTGVPFHEWLEAGQNEMLLNALRVPASEDRREQLLDWAMDAENEEIL